MKLNSIEFTNFRCFKSEKIEFSDYTTLVGPNNCGKSTALRALNIFFSGSSKDYTLDVDDFYIHSSDGDELCLKFEFSEVDGDAAADLGHYVRDGKVIFEIIGSKDDTSITNTKCRGIRFGLQEAAPYFACKNATDKKAAYLDLRGKYENDLPAWSNAGNGDDAVRTFEKTRTSDFVPIPSEENAYGATGPLHILKKYIDWIYVPAVKDASLEAEEQRDSAFSKLILFAVRSQIDFADRIETIKKDAKDAVALVLQDADAVIKKLGSDIDKEFKNLTTSSLDVAIDWATLQDIVLKEPTLRSTFKDGDVLGSLDKFGHGLQRTYLMALLSLVGKSDKGAKDFHLLLGIEEPELYQHPPQARFLADALSGFAKDKSQVVLTTHSPFFINGNTFESVRVLNKNKNVTTVKAWSVDEHRAYCAHRLAKPPIGAKATTSSIDNALRGSISEIFFAQKIVIVEGIEDVGLFEAFLSKTGKYLEFLRAGCHFIPTNGKSAMHPVIALARGFNLDIFCVFDMDMEFDEAGIAKAKESNDSLRRYAEDVDEIIREQPDKEHNSAHFFGWLDNVQATLEREVPDWKTTKEDIALEWGWNVGKMHKHPMLLAETIERLVDQGVELPPLKRLSAALEAFWLK